MPGESLSDLQLHFGYPITNLAFRRYTRSTQSITLRPRWGWKCIPGGLVIRRARRSILPAVLMATVSCLLERTVPFPAGAVLWAQLRKSYRRGLMQMYIKGRRSPAQVATNTFTRRIFGRGPLTF